MVVRTICLISYPFINRIMIERCIMTKVVVSFFLNNVLIYIYNKLY